jgi:hypothetical protein
MAEVALGAQTALADHPSSCLIARAKDAAYGALIVADGAVREGEITFLARQVAIDDVEEVL